jgi:hypothetical protein
MVLHAPSVWERRSLPALIKASLRNQIGLFLCAQNPECYSASMNSPMAVYLFRDSLPSRSNTVVCVGERERIEAAFGGGQLPVLFKGEAVYSNDDQSDISGRLGSEKCIALTSSPPGAGGRTTGETDAATKYKAPLFDRRMSDVWRGSVGGEAREILRKERSGFRQKAPARKERALTPSTRLKLSPAGPMVLHAPSVWERRSLPALNKGQSEKSDWPFPFGVRY